jgi:hypothetical protein
MEKFMRRCVFLSLILLLGVIQPLHAQDDNLPPVLEPEDILVNTDLTVTKQPIVDLDYENYILYYFDADTNQWMAYPYPNEMRVQTPYVITPRSDGTFLINVGSGDPSYYAPDRIEYLWIFDPVEGRIYKPEEMCGTAHALPGEGYWLGYHNLETELFYLCNTETGQTSPPLPSDDYCFLDQDMLVELTPDGEHLLAFCGHSDFTAYSYDIEDDIFLTLGATEQGYDYVQLEDWLSDSRAVIYASEYLANNYFVAYYVVDVDQTGSFELIAGGNGAFPMYDNGRLEWIPSVTALCNYDQDFVQRFTYL